MQYKKILTVILICFLAFVGILLHNSAKSKDVFTFWTIQLKAPAGDLIQKNIDIFKAKHPEIEVVWVDIPIAEAQKRAIAAILGGNPPDLINLNPEFSALLAQKNSLEYFTEDEAAAYNKNLVENLKYNGKIYALPFYATSAVTVLNKEKFKNCTPPKTYDDVLKLTSCKQKPVFGVALNEGDVFAKILNKYNIGSNSLNERDLDAVYKKFQAMKQKDLLLKDTLTINHRESIEKYMAQSAAFITAGSNFITMIKQNAPDIYKKSVVLPQLTGTTGEYDISIMNFVIPLRAKHKNLAKEFAALLLNPENQMELAKKTNVLPANNETLKDKYFKICKNSLEEKARCIAVSQLNKPLKTNFGSKNKKEINETINTSLETLILKGDEYFDAKKTTENLNILINN